jgi:hypothetical protein
VTLFVTLKSASSRDGGSKVVHVINFPTSYYYLSFPVTVFGSCFQVNLRRAENIISFAQAAGGSTWQVSFELAKVSCCIKVEQREREREQPLPSEIKISKPN